MIKVLSMTFLLPKVGAIYIFELWLMLTSVVIVSKSARTVDAGQPKVSNAAHRALIFISILLFFWSSLTLSIAVIRSGENYSEDFLLAAKFALYFITLLSVGRRSISTYFYRYFDYVIYIFFTICCGSYLLYDTQSSSQRLWMAGDFGARFVGFTGASIGLSGVTLSGSTANSVGMLYFLAFAFFWHQGKKKLLPLTVCAVGCVLTLSQTAAASLLVFVIVSLIQSLTSWKSFITGATLVVFGFIFFSTQEFSVVSRISGTVYGILNDGSISTLGDRAVQLQTLNDRISKCPGIILFGAIFSDHDSCGKSAILESFFLNQLSLYGFVGLLLSLLHFFIFSKFIRKSLFGGSSLALGLWFGANLIAANTYQTDFIMMMLLLLLTGHMYNNDSELR